MAVIAPTALVLAAVIRQRNQTLRRLTMQYDVGRALAESVTPAEASRKIIQIVCTSLEWDLGTNWMVDMRDQVLRVTDSWSQPSMDVTEFEELNRSISLKPREGLPGVIWASGQPDWIEDLTSAKNFTRIPIALRNNLRAGFGFPILSGSKVLGVMEFFSRKIRRPDCELLDTVAAIGRQIGQFIERKQAEAALQESNALKAGIVRAALDCIVTMNQAGVIVEFNPAAEATFGYRREEVIGRLMAEVIIPPSLREAHARGLARYLATGEGPVLGKRLELTGMRSDGSLFALELAITRIESDGPPLFAGFLRDISAAKQAAEALRESAERLRFMAESMPQKIFTAKADGRIDYFNQQWTEFTGLSFEQIRDWGWTQFIHPDDLEENVRGWKHSIATGEPFQMQHRFRRADGVYRWHLSRAHALRDNAGRVLMWIGSNTDIEDQKRAEQNLERVVAERTAKLQDTIADLEAFSYSISHDLRAPLRSIAGYIRVIQEDFKEQVLPQVEGYFKRISTAAIRMDQLIQDVLTLSSVAKSDMGMGPVDVEKLLGGILDTYPNLQPPHAEIQIDGPLPPVMGNEAALTQCISNLLGNAVKFVASGVTPRVRIWAQERDGHVRFLFQDNGIGIPKEVHKKIFGMFQRLSTTYQGTGIGLAIVQKSVERMGGEVGIESEPGKGSTFWVELKSATPQ
jgi:PAS domain S-box-containing protein